MSLAISTASAVSTALMVETVGAGFKPGPYNRAPPHHEGESQIVPTIQP